MLVIPHRADSVALGAQVPRGLANLGSFDAAKLAKLRLGIEATSGAVPGDRAAAKPAARADAASARAASQTVTEHATAVQPAPAASIEAAEAGSVLANSTSSAPALAPGGTSNRDNGTPANSAGVEAVMSAPDEAKAIDDDHDPIDSAVRPDALAAALVAKVGAGCEPAAGEDNAARAVDGAALQLPKGDTNVSAPGHSHHACLPGAGCSAMCVSSLRCLVHATRSTNWQEGLTASLCSPLRTCF